MISILKALILRQWRGEKALQAVWLLKLQRVVLLVEPRGSNCAGSYTRRKLVCLGLAGDVKWEKVHVAPAGEGEEPSIGVIVELGRRLDDVIVGYCFSDHQLFIDAWNGGLIGSRRIKR